MPEGDTIYRTARSLRMALDNRLITSAQGMDRFLRAAQISNRRVTAIESRGKHLLIHLDNGSAIHSHLGMTGSWHIYLVGEEWRKPPNHAALILETDQQHRIVCFTPKVLELLTTTELRRHVWLNQLGPDLLAPEFDMNETIRRFRVHNRVNIGEAIMNQTILCGIGNVYKSEVLFRQQIHPEQIVKDLDDETLRGLIQLARDWMRRNLQGSSRQTRFGHDGPRQWVYDRSGEGCHHCGTMILRMRQGDLARSTYYCPTCQRLLARQP